MKILIDAHFQIAGLQNDVVGAIRRPVEEFVSVVYLLGKDNLGKQQQGKHSRQYFHCFLPPFLSTTKGRHRADPNSGVRFAKSRAHHSGLGRDST